MKVYAIGGSRNIGYYASMRLLQQGAIVTFLLRDTGAFDADQTIQEFVSSGKSRLVRGDALNKDDVRQGWIAAGQPDSVDNTAGVDLLLFTLGGTPSFHALHGFVIKPADLCTRATLNVFSTIPHIEGHPPPRVVAVTSVGLSKISHNALPLPMRLMYSLLLGPAHEDKRGMEYILAHCMESSSFTPQAPSSKILPAGWEKTEGLPSRGAVPAIIVLRPALYTGGVCRADQGGSDAYRVRSEGDLPVAGGYTISRRDVAHFIAECLVLGEEWSKFEGKGVSLAY